MSEASKSLAVVLPCAFMAALASAQASLQEPAPKDGRNQHQNYDYTTSDTIIKLCRDALLNNHLVMARTHWVVKPATEERCAYVESFFTITHLPSGETREYQMEWPAVTTAGRPIDKAVAAALTTSMSYFLRDLLLLPRGEDITMDSRDDRGYVPPPQLPPMPKKHAAPAPEHPAAIRPVTAADKPAPTPAPAPAQAAAPATEPAAQEPPVLRHMAEDADAESQADFQRLVTLQESEEIPRAVIERLAARNDMCKPGTPMHMLSKRALRALVENWPTVQRMAAKLK